MTPKDKILEIFLQIREDKGLPWDSKYFMDYLIKPNGKSIDDSFKGKRYKIRFINQIQTAFAVCFTNDFYDKRWNFDEFAAYVDARTKNHAANLKMAQKRLAGAKTADTNILIMMNVILLPISGLFNMPYIWLYLALPATLNILLLTFKIRDIAYHNKLLEIISNSKSS